ncbi:hypothetical protein I0C86_09825 [Plantactinospora sp. S1510]|uniref:Transposase IS4-like domain-containing protein n=1 Tax=Plantactinospora alkalitolerans TaxID=2789879 RepID=A0ABS0GT47_9ACTN|nr:hypothetical protein [Plantactinospora alkalitolerans]
MDFPPWQTVYSQFKEWEKRQVTARLLDLLREEVRLAEGRDPQPSAGIIDSQSVKAANPVGRDTRGYDAGKRVNGRKRLIVIDTLGLPTRASPDVWAAGAEMFPTLILRTCGSRPTRKASWSIRGGGWPSGPWPGSPATAVE